MREYEVLIESITPCGGSKYAVREFLNVETDSPEDYVRGHSPFPITSIAAQPNGDLLIVTGNEAGYITRYLFCA